MNRYSFVEKLTVTVSLIAIILSFPNIHIGIADQNGLVTLAGALIVCAGIIALAIVSRNK